MMSMRPRPEAAATLRNWVEDAADRMDAAGLVFGHGTAAAVDEACWMVSHVLDLAPDFDEEILRSVPPDSDRSALDRLLEQRLDSRRPLAQLIGEAWFAGLRFRVTEDVLVPRSPIAELIRDGFSPWLDPGRPLRAVDVGTGSGCLAAALAWHWPEVRVDALDLSEAALTVAAANVRSLGVEDRVRVLRSDLLESADPAGYELILSNPPYVPHESMRALPDEFRHEPELALAGGADGLDLVRRLLVQAPRYLRPGGILVIEVGEAREALERLLPEVPFIWLEFSDGGTNVFLLDYPGCRQAAATLDPEARSA